MNRKKTRLHWATALGFVLSLLCGNAGLVQAAVDDSKCLECHDQIDPKAFAESAHGKNACNSCHFDVVDLEEHQNCGSKTQQKVETCHRCHPVEGKEHFSSVHMLNDIKCADCHSDIHKLKKWDGNKKSVVEKCLGCHDGEPYVSSVHGKAVEAGNNDSASCADCHGLHKVNELGDPKSHANRLFHTDVCHKCHADMKMMAKNKVPTIAVRTYEESYHGKVESLGSVLAAGCADCHTAHDVRRANDPQSTVNVANLTKTCGACHKGSSIKFAQFLPHADHKDRERDPLLYYTYLAMTGLLVGVFAVFWLHTLLWWRRAYWARSEKALQGNYEVCHIQQPLKPYRRFNVFDRTLHFLMMTSFLGLVITGLPLKFAAAPWAPAIMHLLGGPHMAGFIHRICAIVTFVYFGLCVGYVVYFLLLKPTGESFWQKLFGPDSLFPNLKDVADIKSMFTWFLGGKTEPTFDRWTYWEKFDFLAVFWGMFAIGGSGLMLWFPEFFGRFLPGWTFNVAIIVHSDEALLASGFIFTVHFFNTHFRPGKFPMDMVIFRGTLPKQELCEEREHWCKRIEEKGGLERYAAKPTGPLTDLFSQLLGFTALGIGILCILLVVWGFMTH